MNSYLTNPPESFKEIMSLWDEIKLVFFNNGADKGAKAFEESLATGSWSWEPILSRVPASQIDRLGDVMLGPLFSSNEYPWPESNGLPMIPLVQLNLDRASRLGGVDLGNGLLQVFAKVEDKLGQRLYLREIERSAVAAELMQDLPLFPDSIEGFASVSWAQSAERKKRYPDDDKQLCTQIVGIEDKKFSFWSCSPFSENYNMEAVDLGIRKKLERFDEIIGQHSDEWSPGGFHFFGAFWPIQYYPNEQSKPLLCLESEYGFNFADGQAQIFYSRSKNNGVYFTMDWSCY